ncbi:MAG: type VI secretion system baseplate subunit TssK, partial [Gammaproteobacteria bacterium]
SLEAVFPDGTLVNFPETATLSARSFAAAWTDTNTPFTIYLGLKRLAPTGGNVSQVETINAAQEAPSRFAAVEDIEETLDLYETGPAARVETLTHVVRLFWESEIDGLKDYVLIPAAQLIMDGDSVMHSPAFVPPSIQIGASANMVRILKEVRDDLVGRAAQFEEYKTPMSSSAGGDTSRAVRYRMALLTLSRFAPLLYHHLESMQVHPWMVYGVLRQLVGELSVFTDRVSLLGETLDGERLVPNYDHHRLGSCFGGVTRAISQLLNEISVGPEQLVALDPMEEGLYRCDVPESFFAPRNIFYLVCRTEVPFEDLLDSFNRFAKIGCQREVELFLDRALPGLTARYMKLQPEGLPRRPNATYFRLEKEGSAWAGIQQDKNLALGWDDAPEDLRVDLVTVRR